MNLFFDTGIACKYRSNSQKARVMSENWIADNMFCPCCGNIHITKMENNLSVSDMLCDNCGEIFELKAKKESIGKKIADGAYETMINRITSSTNPDLFIMQYSADFCVENLILVPKFFFVPQIIEKRKPLAQTARRAGWVGCNILYSQIPEQGKIEIINNGNVNSIKDVVENYSKTNRFRLGSIESRGWLFDVLNCVNDIKTTEFTLSQVYAYSEKLKQSHINNNNIEAKIRQQLQFLRDKGFIEFLGNGHYKKTI